MTYQYINNTGVILADTADVLTTVEGEYKAALGADLVTTPDTPQGLLIVSETAARTAVMNNNAAVANQINPNIAGGVFLDAICALLGIYREAATPTVVSSVALAGVPNTPIPKGTRARTAAGDIFATRFAVMLDGTGNVVVDFQSVDTGPIPCGANSLTTIVDAVLGWETVNNPSAGSLGLPQENDTSLRARRRQTLALLGKSSAEAQLSAVRALPNVLSAVFRENVASTTQTIDGIVMAPHSIWVCVDGGADADIATAMLANKTDGAAWNGAHTVNVVDAASGQTYPVQFDRTAYVPIICRVTCSQNTYTGSPNATVPQAVVDYANSALDGLPGMSTGVSASPFEIAAAIMAECPGLLVTKVELATVVAGAGAFAPATIAIPLNQRATIQFNNVTVVVV